MSVSWQTLMAAAAVWGIIILLWAICRTSADADRKSAEMYPTHKQAANRQNQEIGD